jgi:UDP-glucose 4-epimerase
MRILVTGGAGYIGSHTAAFLCERGDYVVVLDSMEFGHKRAIGDIPLVTGHVQDQELVKNTIAEHNIEAIIHFAAYKAAGESMVDPAKYFSNNLTGSLLLIDAARQAGVKRFIFSSSAAVYGTPEKLPVSEEAALNPENPYGESKLLVERALRWFDKCHGFRSIALRYFNAAGAAFGGENGEDPRLVSNLIPIVMNVASGRAEKLKVFGDNYPTPDGTCVRDYIHVLDLAAAHAAALDYLVKNDRSDVFNLGTGQGTSVAEVLKMARDITGKEIPAEIVAHRLGDPAAVWADNTKAVRELGWAPRYGIKEIIGSAWEWSEKHPNGFED